MSEFKNLRSASEYDYPPFCIVNPDSTAGGFSVELLQAACEAMELEISFKIGEWNDIKQELAEGKLDVLPLVGRTPEREHLYDFTFPYMTYHGAVFARKGDNRFKTREDLKNAKLMVLSGDNAEEYARRVKLTSDIETVESFEIAFRNLSEGKCDFVVTQKVMGLNLINQTGITNIAPLDIDVKDFQQNFCFAVKNDNDSLLALINEGLSIIIADGTYNRLQKKWFEPVSEIGKTQLVISYDSNYPPFGFIDEKGTPAGFNVDLINAIAKQLGILIDIKPCKCPEYIDHLFEGEIDAIAGVYYTESKAKNIIFTPPFLTNDHVIIARTDAQTVNGISELKGKNVLVMDNDAMHYYLLEKGFDKEIIPVKSQDEVFKLLEEGKYEYALTGHTFAHYYIEKNKIKNLTVIEKSYVPQEYCFAAKKGNEALIRHITDALAVLKESGEYRKIYSKWLGVYHEAGKDYGRIIKYTVAIITPFLIFLIGFIFWNRSLNAQVNKKTNELKDEIETRKIAEQLLILSEKKLKEKNKLLTESEEKYRQIYESAREGIFMTKPDGTILSANPEACRILGRSEKEITELGRDKLFDIKDPRFSESLEIRSKKGSFRGEINAVAKDGTKIPLMLTSNIYHDSSGDEKTVTIFYDISERKKDELRLEAYLKELEKNKAAMLNILKDVNNEVAVRRKAQEELNKLNTELEDKVKDRTARLEKQNRELSSAQESLMLLLEDVNDTRKEVEEANKKLTTANKELEAFSYSVSHDLRAPLRAILGFSNILKEDYCKGLEDEGMRYMQKIVHNTSKMQKLIDDLLEFSRVGRSSVKIQRIKTVSLLKKIFEEIIEGEKDRKFDFTVNEKIPDIQADRTLVTQLFHNIIGNAVKFTNKKAVSEIRINYENDGKFHIISFKDNGAGFDEKYKHKIFEVFQRLHSSEEFPGTGVGMSIVSKVASKHGWSLDAESRNGNGAIFYMKIPIEDKKEARNEERV
jgi:PAS domain S-box-containing protein